MIRDKIRYLMYKKKSSGVLPDGYTECEYLESNGTQYIKTNIVSTDTMSVEIVMKKPVATSDTVGYLFGYNSGLGARFPASGGVRVGYNTGSWITTTGITFEDTNTIIIKKEGSTFNGTSISVGTVTSSQKFGYIGVFATFNENNKVAFIGSQKICSFKLYDNDILIMNLIPCLDSYGEACMYDTVSGTTFYNQGTGDFLYELAEVLPEGYTQLSYLKSTGTQFINLGYTLDGNSSAEVKFSNPDNTSGGFFGSRVSSSSRMFTMQIQASDKQILSGYNTSLGSSNIYTTTTDTYVVKRDKNVLYVDGVQKSSQTAATFTTPSNAYLFGMYNNAVPTTSVALRIYFCKVWNNGILIRHLIPCLNKDGEACMYDLCDKKEYLNIGTGDFEYGE